MQDVYGDGLRCHNHCISLQRFQAASYHEERECCKTTARSSGDAGESHHTKRDETLQAGAIGGLRCQSRCTKTQHMRAANGRGKRSRVGMLQSIPTTPKRCVVKRRADTPNGRRKGRAAMSSERRTRKRRSFLVTPRPRVEKQRTKLPKGREKGCCRLQQALAAKSARMAAFN